MTFPFKLKKLSIGARINRALRAFLMLLVYCMLGGFILGVIAFSFLMVEVDKEIAPKFENMRWSLPARVYARPLELYIDSKISLGQLKQELELAQYKETDRLNRQGSYRVNADSIDIFTRLNIGKIPLTNAELIKALLLRRGNFSTSEASMKQLQISSEWNLIEQRLQNDSFWYFLCRTSWPFKYDNRIEFIFDLMKDRSVDSEFYFTFNAFNKELEKLADNPVCTTEQAKIEYVWQEVKRTFQTFEEWYEDRTLYHYIGFLIEYGADINELMRKSLEMNKTEFLTDYIKGNKLKGLMRGIKLSDLSYGDKEVKQVLLLFNILTVLQSNKSDMRFPFSKYKKEKWDIEHISSQTDKRINDDGRRLEWIYDMLEFLVGSTEAEEVSAYVDSLKQEIQKSRVKSPYYE